MISLLLHESEVKLKINFKNKAIIQIYLGYNWLITQRILPINVSYSKQWLHDQVMLTYQSFCCPYHIYFLLGSYLRKYCPKKSVQWLHYKTL